MKKKVLLFMSLLFCFCCFVSFVISLNHVFIQTLNKTNSAILKIFRLRLKKTKNKE